MHSIKPMKLFLLYSDFDDLLNHINQKILKEYILYELQQLQIEDEVCAIVSDSGWDIKKAV